MKPLGKKILIAEVAQVKKSTGGIILTNESSQRETKFAKVLEVGVDVVEVVKGDIIVLDWGKCYPVRVDNAERAIVDEEHVLAIQ